MNINVLSLPLRRLLPADVSYSCDGEPFLPASLLPQTVAVKDLFALPAALVSGPPWSGKSHLARQLRQYFRVNGQSQEEDNPFGERFEVTLFEEGGLRPQTEPAWWSSWRSGNERACWVVDAIDEDDAPNRRQIYHVLDMVDRLTEEERKRLCLILLCRENDVPKKLLERLGEIYPEKEMGSGSYRCFKLAPLSECEAIVHLKSHEEFQRVLKLIRDNRLHSIGWLPAVMDAVAGMSEDSEITAEQVWRKILEKLLKDNRQNTEEGLPEIEKRFRATARMAACLMLAGQSLISRDDSSLLSAISVSDIFPQTMPHYEVARKAARASLSSAVFTRYDSDYRFSQRHVLEWFAAFGLSDLELNALRPLLSDENGDPKSDLRGVCSLLARVTPSPDTRDWIIDLHGGIPLRSDAAPWTLKDVIDVIDRIIVHADASHYGLAYSNREEYKNLQVDGIGTILCERLRDPGHSLAARETVAEIAEATNAVAIAPMALNIIKDDQENVHLRRTCAFVLKGIGTSEILQELAHFAEQFRPRDNEERRLHSAIGYTLYDRKVFAFAKVAKCLWPEPPNEIGESSLLLFHLEQDMTLDNAREILGDKGYLSLFKAPEGARRRYRRRGSLRLIDKALDLISHQKRLDGQDYRLLRPFLLPGLEIDPDRSQLVAIAQKIGEDDVLRRHLFEEGLRQDPTSNKVNWYHWRWILRHEDLAWLRDVCQHHATESNWLYEDLLNLSYQGNVSRSERQKVRQFVRRTAPQTLHQFDKNRLKRRHNQNHTAQRIQKRKEEHKEVPLSEVVQKTLDFPNASIKDKALHLSWCCFSEEHSRPINVVGTWEMLAEDLKHQILSICEKHLQQGKPTEVPTGRQWPVAIHYEAQMFSKVLEYVHDFELNQKMVRKWLPAVLWDQPERSQNTINLCNEAAPAQTQKDILAQIRRQLASEGNSFVSISWIPEKAYTDDLVNQLAQLVEDKIYVIQLRTELLRALVRRSHSQLSEIVKSWSFTNEKDGDTPEVRQAVGIDLLLGISPGEALEAMVIGGKGTSPGFLLRMRSLTEFRPENAVSFVEWRVQWLRELTDLVYTAFPLDEYPTVRLEGTVTPLQDICFLRDRLPSMIWDRDSREARAALEELSLKHEPVREYFEFRKANVGVNKILDAVAPSGDGTLLQASCIPVKEIVRLLDENQYRLILSSADLQRVLIEELETIARDAGNHLSMLYSSDKTDGERVRLDEEALQAYLQCRLNDRLPNKVLSPETSVTFINRETLANRNQRNDIKIESLTAKGEKATVIIEVKWSDNKEVSIGLTEQLGQHYLVDGGLTHGIYFVGWCGKLHSWKKSAIGQRPDSLQNMNLCSDALENQSREFQKNHPAVSIKSFIADLAWGRLCEGAKTWKSSESLTSAGLGRSTLHLAKRRNNKVQNKTG